MPLGCWSVYVRNSSGSRSAASSRASSSRLCFGCRLRCDDTCPNERSRSISSVPVGFRSPASNARLTAIVVVPTPPLGLNTDTMRRPRGSPIAVTATTEPLLRPLEAQRQRLDPGLQLGLVEGLRDDVVGAGLEQGDPLLEVVGLGDRQDRDRLGRLVAAQLLDDRGDRERRGHLVDDDEAVAGRRREQVDRVRDGRDAVARFREGRRQRLARDAVGREEENRKLQHVPRGCGRLRPERSRREEYRVAATGP